MERSLSIKAGPKALEILRERGLQAQDVRIIPGAAGGPKWLVLAQLDRLIFGEWLRGSERPVHLVGSSIGALRFGAACQGDPVAAFDAFEEAYLGQRYSAEPTPEEISEGTAGVIRSYYSPEGAEAILKHDRLRLNVITVRGRGPTSSEWKPMLGLGLGLAASANALSRRWIGAFFERVIFHRSSGALPLEEPHGRRFRGVALSEANLFDALLASSSIPLLMAGVTDPAGAPEGVYRDGGIIDYHMDLPYGVGEGEIVLYPHFSADLTPGWFDKHLPWRKPDPRHLESVVVVHPSPEFVASLPLGQISDRQDFYRFAGRDEERVDYWRSIVTRAGALANEFRELAESPVKLRGRVEPLAF